MHFFFLPLSPTPKSHFLTSKGYAVTMKQEKMSVWSGPFLFFGLFFPVHADTQAGQQTFSLYHIALPDSVPVISYNKEKNNKEA